jgi:anti-anti-sigma factor
MYEQCTDVSTTTLVETIGQHEVPIVTVTGEVDMSTVQVVHAELADKLDRRPAALIIDLGAVSFFGSAGINTLMHAHLNARQSGTEIVLITAQSAVLRPLQLTGVAELFSIQPTLRDALAASSVVRRAAGLE